LAGLHKEILSVAHAQFINSLIMVGGEREERERERRERERRGRRGGSISAWYNGVAALFSLQFGSIIGKIKVSLNFKLSLFKNLSLFF